MEKNPETPPQAIATLQEIEFIGNLHEAKWNDALDE